MKAWVEFVYHPIRKHTDETFFKFLLDLRVSNIGADFVANPLSVQNHKSYQSLHSKLMQLKSQSMENQIEYFLKAKQKHETIFEILQSYAISVADVSLNEVSVHSINHSDQPVDAIYKAFEAKLIKQTKRIFAQIHPNLLGRDFVECFLSTDSQIISTIFLPKATSDYFQASLNMLLCMFHEGSDFSSSSADGYRGGPLLTTMKIDTVMGRSKNISTQQPASNPKELQDNLRKELFNFELSSEDEMDRVTNIQKAQSDFNAIKGKNSLRSPLTLEPQIKRSTSINHGEAAPEILEQPIPSLKSILVVSRSTSTSCWTKSLLAFKIEISG